ncbi:hypothetical protein GJ744_009219 [Endocarpon pusillum]|uniref:SET domain-containing protein n=1 Tax=Endocarpon pusillum TaxID=364733 RepID=A0A8H7AK53_9EURO|nr:hypothetical protein GJ744_009219 [Endocarpon pusillum]
MAEEQTENAADRFQELSSNFLKWFKFNPDTRLSTKITLADLRSGGAGRGVVTIAAISPGEELFAIPRNLVLQTTNSELYSKIPDFFADLGPWDSLILVLIYEYLRRDSSPWFPYLQLLPTTFDTLMFWTPAELLELQGSAVVDKVGKGSAEENWNHTILPIMMENEALFPLSTENATDRQRQLLRFAHMTGSMIMAYAFDLDADSYGSSDQNAADEGDSDLTEDEDNPTKGMVAFADMLNADAHRNNARLFHENDFLIMKATKVIRAEEEVFNDYGPLPRSDLLRMYGYVTDNYSTFDVVEISADLIENVAASSGMDRSYLIQKRRDLESLGLIDDAFVIVRPKSGSKLDDIIPEDLRMLITAFCQPGEKSHTSKLSQNVKESSLALSEACLLFTTITNRLGDYKSSLQEDSDILEKLKYKDKHPLPDGVSHKRYEMAVQVRKGEKEILQQVMQQLQDLVNAHTRQIARDPAKRKKNETKTTSLSKKRLMPEQFNSFSTSEAHDQ